MIAYIFFGIAVLLSSAVSNHIPSVDKLDLERYEGHWYQVYASPFDYTFQGYGKCITANYGITGPNNVSVLNSQFSKTDELQEIAGYAFYKDPSKPGELSVSLEGVPAIAPYWVVSLGERGSLPYLYSVVSVPNGPSLWVLARNVTEFFEKYDSEVTAFLDSYNLIYVLVDQTNCPDLFV